MSPRDPALRRLWALLIRRVRLILLVIIVVVGVAVGASLVRSAKYRVGSDVLLSGGAAIGQRDAGAVVQTEIRVALSGSVRQAVRQRLGFAPEISARPIARARAFTVEARSSSRTQAVTVANTYASTYIELRRRQGVSDATRASEALISQVADLQHQIEAPTGTAPSRREVLVTQQAALKRQIDQTMAEAQQAAIGATVMTPATAARVHAAASLTRTAAIGLGLGVLLGCALALALDHLDVSVRTRSDLEQASSLPTLGLIPPERHWRDASQPLVISRTAPSSLGAEAYRTLRTAVDFAVAERSIHVLQVASPMVGEGATTTVANLSVVLAHAGLRVIAVDADLRQPRLHDFLGLPNKSGFTSVLLGEVPLSSALQPVPGEQRLLLLSSGPLPPNPSEVLASKRTVELLTALHTNCDLVLLDSPPVLPVTDAVVLSEVADGTLLVAAGRHSSRLQVARAVEMLRHVQAHLIGTVLNGVSDPTILRYTRSEPPAPLAHDQEQWADRAPGTPG